MNINQRIADELHVSEKQVATAVGLIGEGATVPFIARYRKEMTGGLDDIQLRFLEERLGYLRELDERRGVILKSIGEQGKLSADLEAAIQAADSKVRLEDLYLPFKPKRRTKAKLAREAGLAPLARELMQDPAREPEVLAATYVNVERGVDDVGAALEGARQILMEAFTEDAELMGLLRDFAWENGALQSRLREDKVDEGEKFADYFDYRESIKNIPSHRALALFRGRNEGVLQLTLELGDDTASDPCESMIARHFGIKDHGRPGDGWLKETVRWAWRVKILTRLELELKQRLREAAEEEAIRVFARNLHDLLLAAPAGPRPIIGLDPGLRTGVKVAVVSATGKLLDTDTIYPHPPRNQWDEAIQALAQLIRRHDVELISIGNGTGSRETDRLVMDLMKRHPEPRVRKLVVSEAGASVYSASEGAAQEFPTLDVSLRGAVSIARRLQDPLAELVKIDPKSIGVGQYQHDVSQARLARSLNAVVEDCVNAVGVDVNTASSALLARVAGLSAGLARNIVDYRDVHGPFASRQKLLSVPRLGEKTFEQAAGFLRIMEGGDNPLDRSAVHPEAYPVVQRILAATGRSVGGVIGNVDVLKQIDPRDFIDERFGLPTVKDILAELEKPGRDPRPEFRTAAFQEGVEKLEDLRSGMVLEGVVTNVTNFGAFVDIGVHQDGLVHISVLADRFVRSPHDVVKTGDIVRVKVVEVDAKRRRIALSMCFGYDSQDQASIPAAEKTVNRKQRAKRAPGPNRQQAQGSLAEAFARARRR